MTPPFMDVLFLVKLDPPRSHQITTAFRPFVPHLIVLLDIGAYIEFGVRPIHPHFLLGAGG